MNLIKLMGSSGLAAVLSLSFVLVLPSVSAANDTVVGAGAILIISDELNGNSAEVIRNDAGSGGGGPCDSSGTDSSNSSSDSGGAGNTSNNCSNNSSTDT